MNFNKGLNILIINAHWNNRGDEAAIRAMIDSFRSNLPINNMKIMMISQNVTQFPYADIELVDLYPSYKKKISSILAYGADLFLTLFTFGNIAFTKQGKEYIRAVNDTDVVIHAPGGPSIGDLYCGKYCHIETSYLHRLLIPILKSKPIFFYAPSMGPFSGILRNNIRKFVLKRANGLIVREEISSKYLKEQLGLDSYVTIDSALQNDIQGDYINKYDNISEILDIIENEKVVGMTITDLKWHPVYRSYNGLHEKIMHALSDLISHLIDKGYVLLLIPQLFGEQEDREKPLLEHLHRINEEKIFIFPSNVDSYGQQAIISKLFCIIGMRYHPNIFAAKGNVPSICIYYEHKAKGFMEKLGLRNLVINVEDISASRIIEKFTYLEGNYNQIKEGIKKRIPQLKELSNTTTEIIIRNLTDAESNTGK